MKIPLKIETHDKRLGYEIAAVENSLSAGTVVEAPGGAKLEYKCTHVRKAVGIPEILEFIVEASVTIELSLFAAWLYDKVKNKPVDKIVIRRKEITEITEENIKKTLEEEIHINE